jgi:Fe2+ or Zn2+ uptake regulation protein
MDADIVEHLVIDPDESEQPPSFFELLQLARDNGLVGEEDTLLTVTVAAVRGGLVVLYGISRGGKDWVIERALELFPPDYSYEWSSGSDSDTANYYDAERLNEYDVHYLGDLARMDDTTEKIAKPWGEGKDAKRKKTNMAAAEGDEVDTQTLECPRTVFASIATDNRNFDLNDWPEFQKRAFMQGVDGSKSQTEAILRRKALEHADRIEKNISPVDAARIREYMGSIPVNDFHEHPNNKIVNPASLNIIEQKPIPTEFAEARFDGDKLLGFIETVTLMRHVNRFTVDTGRGFKMLTTPTDVWFTMKIMGENMVMSALNLTDEDQAIIRYLRESNETPTKRDIQQDLRAAGYNIQSKDVTRSIDSMMDRGYVRVASDNGGAHTFTLSEFASITTHEVGLDYSGVVEAAAEGVYEIPSIPEEVADAYVERFCEGSGLFATDPYTGEELNIIEDDSLQEAVNEATEDVADIFDDDPFYGGDEDDGPSDEIDVETQGTLA